MLVVNIGSDSNQNTINILICKLLPSKMLWITYFQKLYHYNTKIRHIRYQFDYLNKKNKYLGNATIYYEMYIGLYDLNELDINICDDISTWSEIRFYKGYGNTVFLFLFYQIKQFF